MLKWYTDGACSLNPGPGGYAAILVDENENKVEEISGNAETTTNNRMEMLAILAALKTMDISYSFTKKSFTIYSDSAYCVNMCNVWISSWEKNGWKRAKNQPIENLDLVLELSKYLKKFDGQVHIMKVPGHSGVQWNEEADKLAVAAKNRRI